MANGTRRAVIVGAGVAGAEAVIALRRQGFAGEITMIGEERHAPYQRPPLSKSYLSGEASTESLYVKPKHEYQKAGIDVMLGVRAARIDRTSKQVVLSDGREVKYDTLILALGGRARNLDSLPPGRHGSIHNLYTIRTIDDVDRLKNEFRAATRIVIVGGGYIGLEVAAVAVKLGLRVLVLERLSRVLARVTAPQVSAFYEGIHREAGVEVRTEAEILGFDFDASSKVIRAVNCGDGEAIPADLVIAGIGMTPNAELASAAGLAVGDGILTDASARTSDDSIFAIGDCSNHPCAPDGQCVRLESQPSALDQARTATAAICGKEPRNPAVPWFWSDQYDVKLQIAGLSKGYDRVVLRGSPEARRFSVLYLKQARVIAADAVNCPQDFGAARNLILRRTEVDLDRLADTRFPLAGLV